MRNFYYTQRGQTLLELVIAIGVITVIITALVVAATSSLRFSQESKLRTTAVRYGQEALELVRNLRDTRDWDSFMAYSGSGTQAWCLDSNNDWAVSSGSCPLMSSATPFSRMVTFTWNDPEMIVAVDIQWQVGDSQQHTSVKTYFTQWR